MALGVPPADAGRGPEREDAPEPFFDRLFAGIGFRWHNAFARRSQEPVAFASDVAQWARRSAAGPAAPGLSDLRYRLRRDGLRPALVAECFGHYCAGLSGAGTDSPGPDALGAALILLKGGIAELAGAADRRHALALAATAWAIYGIPVHVVTGSDARARAAAEALQAPLAALGFSVAVVTQGMDARARRVAYSAPLVCGTQREIAHDYLRDRLALGGRPRHLTGMVHRLAGDAARGGDPLLRGLQCALVEDADAVLLDDAHLPLVIASDAEQPRERLVYEQALELARALSRGADFTLDDDGARLTDAGVQRIERLVGPLGGIWAARQRREELISLSLDALYLRERGVDYRVEQDRVALAKSGDGGADEPMEADETLNRLIEVKEGCRLGVRPDVRARLSVPRFFRRYRHLGGACADARGAEGEFWTLYGLKTTLVGAPPSPISSSTRVLATVAAKRTALVDRARALAAAGNSLLIAVRSPAEARALHGALGEAGLDAGVVQGTGSAAEHQALDRLDSPGGIVLALYPAAHRIDRSATGRAPLKVVVAELHDARRHVERICRTFAADSCEMLLSLEDDKVVAHLGPAATWWARRGMRGGGELHEGRSHWLAVFAQRGAERSSAAMRQEILLRDRQLDDLLAFSGKRE